MDSPAILQMLESVQRELVDESGQAAVEKFGGLRDVDNKAREVRHILGMLPNLPPTFLDEMSHDEAFTAQSRRIRLEALNSYVRSAVKFIQSGVLRKPEKILVPPPDVTKLTVSLPNLDQTIARRWLEAQRCIHAECFTAAVVLMGSVLEALLLGRAMISIGEANQSSRAPRDKTGRILAVHDWNLNALLEVAIERRWLKSDRGKFGHALRESRNVVHPWTEVTTHANFDLATCKTSWEVLQASVADLIESCR